jgi:hypothetical protein
LGAWLQKKKKEGTMRGKTPREAVTFRGPAQLVHAESSDSLAWTATNL